MWHHNHAQVHFCASQSNSARLLLLAGARTGVCHREPCVLFKNMQALESCIMFTFSEGEKKKKENDLITLNSQNETMHAFAAFWPLLLVNDPRREALQWGQWSSGSQRSRHLHLHLHLPLLCSATHTDGPHTRTHRCTHRHKRLPSHPSNNRPIH